MLGLLPWIISGIGSLASAFIANRGAQQRQDSMNAYNTPAAQMARYKAGGLNPLLVYGQGTPGNQPAPAQYDAPQIAEAVAGTMVKHQAYIESKTRSNKNDTGAAVNSSVQSLNELKKMFMDAQKNAALPYLDRNAQYSSALLRQQVINMIRRGGMDAVQKVNMLLDQKIKGNIVDEGDFNRRMRKFGISKDSGTLGTVLRMGTNAVQHMMSRPAKSQKAGKPGH